MAPKGYLIIDGNSLGHYYNNGAKLTIGNAQVQAIFGFLKCVRSMCATYANLQPVVVWDGASWRKMLLRSYKEIRDRAVTPNELKLAAAKAEYKKQVPAIQKALRLMGVPQVSALNMEADDLGAIMADRYAAQGALVVLVTGDKDWLQLVGPKVIWKDPINDRMVTAKNFEDFTGVKTTRQFVEMKALAGDQGDSVPGVGGIGEKGAIDFLNTYGSVADFTSQCLLEKTIDIKKLPKKYRALVEDENKAIAFAGNINLVDLRSPARPAPVNLHIDKGTPDAAKLRLLCETLLFQSITKNFDEWISVFPRLRGTEAAPAAA
ncbi:5'-3' exonuclease H3TH domain-containing protein [Ancylobacter rudongensis]|uniref:5'-3' exonuclease n=1 Tax=Ancylobacter rudongensis TaxID=177413 RepID=A0A1G4UQ78_9HYPH|nr:5'-3' exonuclease H3TH domain-containing protein [Ancylobacter rudongensis]SCW95790.1 5'-3' exonuclease [Ancylobacter rudongensis]